MAQLYGGTQSLVADCCRMKSKKAFVHPLLGIVQERGAPTKLVSDLDAEEISEKAKDILIHLHFADWQSEAHHQHQNPFERCHLEDLAFAAN